MAVLGAIGGGAVRHTQFRHHIVRLASNEGPCMFFLKKETPILEVRFHLVRKNSPPSQGVLGLVPGTEILEWPGFRILVGLARSISQFPGTTVNFSTVAYMKSGINILLLIHTWDITRFLLYQLLNIGTKYARYTGSVFGFSEGTEAYGGSRAMLFLHHRMLFTWVTPPRDDLSLDLDNLESKNWTWVLGFLCDTNIGVMRVIPR